MHNSENFNKRCVYCNQPLPTYEGTIEDIRKWGEDVDEEAFKEAIKSSNYIMPKPEEIKIFRTSHVCLPDCKGGLGPCRPKDAERISTVKNKRKWEDKPANKDSVIKADPKCIELTKEQEDKDNER